MAKNDNNVADKTSKKVIIWLSIVSAIFFSPFIGVFINEIKFGYICDLYTLGLDRKDFFSVWIALFGAIGIAINIYQNHRRTTNQDIQLVNQNIQLEKQAEQIQLQGTQLELQSKSQRDSRFSKGVELLGNANESARTGAAYSLFFLAKDYPEEFAKPVFEILCSHIRNITNKEEYKTNNERRPSNEMQSIIDLVFRRPDGVYLFNGFSANLSGSYLVRANFYKAYLSNANLEGIKLGQADLAHAYLVNANLIYADLELAKLYNCNLAHANLTEANFSSCKLMGATLEKVIFTNANFSYVRFDSSIRFSNYKKLLDAKIELSNFDGIPHPRDAV